jgi:hypothetical protein
MKCKKLGKQLLLFTFRTQKEITTTFFRMEEYYESPIKRLYQNKFNVFDFLIESMNDEGHIDYFSKWIGFNIPGHSIKEWSELHCPNYTPKEMEVLNHITSKVDVSQPFYVIAAKEGKTDVMDHEIAHALYYLDKSYKARMSGLVLHFKQKFPVQYKKVQTWLKNMGYNKSVFTDESQAYMSTSDKKEIMAKFGITSTEYKKMERIVLEFRDVLYEYNTFKK